MGAHPSAPSGVTRAGGVRTTLDAVIAADPAGELGAGVRGAVRRAAAVPAEGARRREGAVHPGAPVARAGRGRVPARRPSAAWRRATSPATTSTTGPSRRSSARSPRSRCWPGCGPPRTPPRCCGELGVGELDPVAAISAAAAGPRGAHRGARRDPDLARRGPRRAGRRGRGRLRAGRGGRRRATPRPPRRPCGSAREHPGDLGVVASLLLRHAVLRPGEAVFLPAGGLHSYLHGTGVELLANSDNVVRAGLTAKHIDVPELLRLTDPAVAVPGHRAAAARRRRVRLRLARRRSSGCTGPSSAAAHGRPARRRAADRAVHRGRAALRRRRAADARRSAGANRASCPRRTARSPPRARRSSSSPRAALTADGHLIAIHLHVQMNCN